MDLTQELAQCMDEVKPRELSGDVLKQCCDLEQNIKDMMSDASTSAPSDSEFGDGDMSEMSQVDIAFKVASENNGEFPIRASKVGHQWSKAVKKDDDLRARYLACAGYAEQRAFRAAWACESWKEIARTRTTRTTMSESIRSTWGVPACAEGDFGGRGH